MTKTFNKNEFIDNTLLELSEKFPEFFTVRYGAGGQVVVLNDPSGIGQAIKESLNEAITEAYAQGHNDGQEFEKINTHGGGGMSLSL